MVLVGNRRIRRFVGARYYDLEAVGMGSVYKDLRIRVDTKRGSPHAERPPCGVVLGEVVPSVALVAVVSSDFA